MGRLRIDRRKTIADRVDRTAAYLSLLAKLASATNSQKVSGDIIGGIIFRI